jgi:hypothetical protein
MLSVITSLTTINMIIQIILMAVVVWASYLAIKRKMNLKKHCTFFRWAVLAQIAVILAFMLLPMLGYISSPQSATIFFIEIWTHHVLGLIVVGIWVYVNLVQWRVIKHKGRLKNYMLIALVAWILTFLIGLHIYAYLYLLP